MNKKGMEQVGAFTPDNLIAGNRHPVDVCHVVIKEGQKLLRGTLLEKSAEESDKYVIRGTQPEGSSAEYILADDVDALEEDTVGLAYRTGEFAQNAVIVKEGYSITEEDKTELRRLGIFLAVIMM